jgi:hypothetical protein
MVRAFDARLDGASYRDIATVLFASPKTARLPARDWKQSAEHSRVFRLVKNAGTLVDGGYRKLLGGGWL